MRKKSQLDASYIILWGIDNKNPEVTLEGQYDSKKYSNNNIFKINPSKINDTTYILKIKAKANDVINIGSKLFDTNLKSSLNGAISYSIINLINNWSFIHMSYLLLFILMINKYLQIQVLLNYLLI